jgi:NitT/TauT family transport system substrate-binding protein
LKKKTTIAAILVVAILVVGGLLVVLWPQSSQPSKVIYWTTIPPAQQQAALEAGTVDAAVGWEPYSSAALADGRTSVVVWSGEVWPDHPCCVMAVDYSSSFQKNATNMDLVARVVRADIDANNWILKTIQEGSGDNYTLLLSMGSAFSGCNTTVVQDSLAHIKFSYNLTEGVKEAMANFTDMFLSLQQISNYGGYANATAFVDSLVDPSYLQAAMSVTPSPTILGTVKLGYLLGDLHQFARLVAQNTTIWGGQTLFEKYGVQITSPTPYANGGAIMDAFAAGTINMGYLGCPPAILKTINVGTNIQVVALVNSEGSAIIAKSPIDTLAGLNGKLVATPGPASIQHLLLLYYATENGYQLKLVGT